MGKELYREGNNEVEFMNILQKNMQPVYDSARRQEYEVWDRGWLHGNIKSRLEVIS